MPLQVKQKSKLIAAIATVVIHILLVLALNISLGEQSSSALNQQDEAFLMQLEDFVTEDIKIAPPGKDPLTDKQDKASESLSKNGKGAVKTSETAVMRDVPRQLEPEMIKETDSILKKKQEVAQIIKVDTVKPELTIDSAMAEVMKQAEQMINKDVKKKTSSMSPQERIAFFRKNYRSILAFKKVYPYALKTREIMETLNKQLATMTDESQKKQLIKDTEKMLFKNYENAVRTMSRSQGQLLLKLIARETNKTGYEIIKQYKGAFTATFWYGVGKIFGTDLKSEYHREKEDSMIEVILQRYKSNDLY